MFSAWLELNFKLLLDQITITNGSNEHMADLF